MTIPVNLPQLIRQELRTLEPQDLDAVLLELLRLKREQAARLMDLTPAEFKEVFDR